MKTEEKMIYRGLLAIIALSIAGMISCELAPSFVIAIVPLSIASCVLALVATRLAVLQERKEKKEDKERIKEIMKVES